MIKQTRELTTWVDKDFGIAVTEALSKALGHAIDFLRLAR